jgi:type I restriction enzyme R subunit
VWLAKIYQAALPTDLSGLVWDRVGTKTRELVYSNIRNITVRNPDGIVQIADSTTIQKLIDIGLLDIDDTVTVAKTPEQLVEEINERLRKRLAGANGTHPQYKGLAERLERLRASELSRATDSYEYLREFFEIAKDLTNAEKAEDENGLTGLNILPNPNLGALSQIFAAYKNDSTPAIIGTIVDEVDRIVKEVSYPGWELRPDGVREVKKSLVQVFKKFGLQLTGEPMDSAYNYIEANY